MCKSCFNLKDRISTIKNIIFDMDGTLVDTSKVTVPACNQTAVEFGLPEIDSKKIIGLIGWADPEFYYRLYPGIDKIKIMKYSKLVAIKEKQYMAHLKTQILFSGVLELIKVLKSNKFYISIASTGSFDHVRAALTYSGIYNEFDYIKCNESTKVNMVKNIIENGPKGDWLIVGDKSKDSEAGIKNGIVRIGAKYGYGTSNEMGEFNITINTPLDLLNLLHLNHEIRKTNGNILNLVTK